MRTNTKLIETKTYVNRDKRSIIVVQKYELDIFALKNFVEAAEACADVKNYAQYSITPIGKFKFENNKLVLTVSGKSRCMPNDKFDETLGFRIADTRAQAKAMKIFAKFYEGLYNLIYDNFVCDVQSKYDNCCDAYWGCKQHETRLIESDL